MSDPTHRTSIPYRQEKSGHLCVGAPPQAHPPLLRRKRTLRLPTDTQGSDRVSHPDWRWSLPETKAHHPHVRFSINRKQCVFSMTDTIVKNEDKHKGTLLLQRDYKSQIVCVGDHRTAHIGQADGQTPTKQKKKKNE